MAVWGGLANSCEKRCSEGSNKPCVHQDPETPQRLSQNCVWVSPAEVWVKSGLLQGQGLWVQQTWVCHKPSWRRSPLTPPQSWQKLQTTGETDTWRAQTKPCAHQDPGERSSDPTRDWPSLACRCPGVSGRGVGWQWSTTGLGTVSAPVCAWTFWRWLPLSSLPPHRSVSGQQQGGNTALPINRKLDILISNLFYT